VYRRRSNKKKRFLLGLVLLVIIITAVGAYIILNNNDAYTLDVIVEGSGSVVKSPDQTFYSYDDAISLTATASDSWRFAGWSGDFSGLFNPDTVVLDGNKTVTATFVEKIDTDPARVLLTTTMGNISIELRNDMPITTENFKMLIQQGIYDNTIFHRVIPDFMIQGGDPTGTGFGDPTIPNIPDEFTDNNLNNRGTIAMANAGPNTGSSQFFINIVNNNHLDTKHPVFGRVIEGMDVVDAISLVPVDNEKPIEDVFILEMEILS
jgi:peptidylprolyl isomerase